MLRIYGTPVSVHTRKVIVAAIAKGLDHEVVPVVPVIPGNPPPNWRELSPTGLIPALSDGDFTVSDSTAICAYLERLHPAEPLYPREARAHARALSLEQYAGTVFSAVVRPLFHEVFVHPKLRNIATDQSKIDAVLTKEMPERFGYLDGAAHGGFLAGAAMSMADISVVSNLVTFQYIGFGLDRSRFPRLAVLFDRVVRQPAMREALRREEAAVDAMGLRRDFLGGALGTVAAWMFRIGDFSRIARVSCRLLRYYDELGLLQPARVEQETGYRYYSAAQLPRLNRILVLKELGMSLEQIARIVDANPSAAELRAMLLVRRNDAERAVEEQAARLRQIETRIAQVDAEGVLSVDDVVVRPEPARTLLSLRRTVASFAEARGLIGELHASVKGRPPGALMAVAHAQSFELDEIDVEFGFVLEGGATQRPKRADPSLNLRELPAEDSVAICVRIGLPEDAHLVTGKIGRHVEANGYGLAGPSRELFLQPPQPDRMDEAVVEMQFPIKKKPA